MAAIGTWFGHWFWRWAGGGEGRSPYPRRGRGREIHRTPGYQRLAYLYHRSSLAPGDVPEYMTHRSGQAMTRVSIQTTEMVKP